MKVSTELKRLINLRFEELKSEMNKKYREEANAIYEARIAEIEASPAWKEYIEASLNLYEYLEPDYHEVGRPYDSKSKKDSAYYYRELEYLKHRSASDFITKYETNYANHHANISDLNNQRDKLLIKLTYEKKLENIEEMLAEYGIKL